MKDSVTHRHAEARVAIIEDDLTFAAELGEWLREKPEFRIVGEYMQAELALEQLPIAKPTIAIVDLKLPGIGGVEFIRKAKRQDSELVCVVLTQFDDSDLLFTALASGADSYLLKDDSSDRILQGLREARHGGSVMSPSIGRKILDFFQRPAICEEASRALSSRQIEILTLARRGKTAKEIARVVGLSPETVRTHFRNIYRALQVHSVGEALDRTFHSRLRTRV